MKCSIDTLSVLADQAGRPSQSDNESEGVQGTHRVTITYSDAMSKLTANVAYSRRNLVTAWNQAPIFMHY